MANRRAEGLFGSVASVGLVLAALLVHSFSQWVINMSIYPAVGSYCGIAREFSTLLISALYLLLGLVSMKKPSLLDRRLLLVIGVGSAVAACAVLGLALPTQDAAGTFAGLAFRSISEVVAVAVLTLAVASLKERTALVAVVSCSILSSALTSVLPPLEVEAAPLALLVIMLSVYVLAAMPAEPLRKMIAEGSPASDIELTNPYAFLSWRSKLYWYLLLFGVAYGFSLTFSVGSGPSLFAATEAVVLLGFMAYVLAKPRSYGEDVLFSLSALCMLAGFAAIPMAVCSDVNFANSLFRAATGCVAVLVWVIIVHVSKRNPYTVLPTLCLMRFMQSTGVFAGAAVGHNANAVISSNTAFVVGCSMVCLVLFCGFLWVCFRDFSFSAAVGSLTPVRGEESLGRQEPALNRTSGIEGFCEHLGEERGLTRREIEIFVLLAKGRNGAYIQEHYVVSRNTAKTHIRHIYTKLDVHSQQELINLVEEGVAERPDSGVSE